MSRGRIIDNPLVWWWAVIVLLTGMCAKPVLIVILGTTGLIPTQDATPFDYSSDSYVTQYTGNKLTTETYEFVLADGRHVTAAASELPHWPSFQGNTAKIGLLGDTIATINGTFIAPLGLPMLILFVFCCYLATLCAIITAWVYRRKLSMDKVRAEARGFAVGALCAGIVMVFIVLPCMFLDAFNVPGWPIGVIALGGLVFAISA